MLHFFTETMASDGGYEVDIAETDYEEFGGDEKPKVMKKFMKAGTLFRRLGKNLTILRKLRKNSTTCT